MTSPALERFLTYRLHTINKITDRDTNRAYLRDCGIPLGEARCLAAIGRYAPLSVNDLALAANLNKGQASRSAQALVERGLIEKGVGRRRPRRRAVAHRRRPGAVPAHHGPDRAPQ